MSASVALTCCPAFLPAASGPELAKSIDSTENLAGDCNRKHLPMLPPEEEVRDIKNANGNIAFTGKQDPSDRVKKGSILEDHMRDWVKRRVNSGVPESRCFLPFLVGAKKMVFFCVFVYLVINSTFPDCEFCDGFFFLIYIGFWVKWSLCEEIGLVLVYYLELFVHWILNSISDLWSFEIIDSLT